ncbi:MAG: ACP S-malonyltransferase [Campylobacterales bacterium]|nr:ACP S-malonyltransferase [Campylobacterales bacterium]
MKKVAFIFPGQGSQSIGMGKEFFDNSEMAKNHLEKVSDRLSINFSSILFENNTQLDETEYSQPAILLVSMMAYKLFQERVSIRPEFVLGHSLGEFSAVCSVDGLDIVDATLLVHKRGLFMKRSCEGKNAGMMAIIGIDDEKLKKCIDEAQFSGKQVWCANYNGDGQVVLAGLKDDLSSIEPILKEYGAKKSVLLNMSVASHCKLLEDAKIDLEKELNIYLKDSFNAPVVSNVNMEKYSKKERAIELLPMQLVNPVLYKQSIKKYEDEVDLFIEFGNGSVLKGLNKRITQKPTISINSMKSIDEAIELLS